MDITEFIHQGREKDTRSESLKIVRSKHRGNVEFKLETVLKGEKIAFLTRDNIAKIATVVLFYFFSDFE